MKVYKVNNHLSTSLQVDWNQAHCLEDLSYPWEAGGSTNTSFRALCDKSYLYFHFEVRKDSILTYIKDNHKLEVVNSDRVELFFAAGSSLAEYYCLEIDSFARVLDYKASFYRKFEYNWKWPAGEIEITSHPLKNGYVVEGQLSLKSLNELGILSNNNMIVGIYRGECTQLAGSKATLRWISWIHPKTEEPDFHVPSSFGRFVLVD